MPPAATPPSSGSPGPGSPGSGSPGPALGLGLLLAVVLAAGAVGYSLQDPVSSADLPPLDPPAATGPASTARPRPSAKAHPSSSARRRGDPTYSNIQQRDYVGPMACRGCHTEIYERWNSHPHARMNANANASTVVGAFDGRRLRYGDAEVLFDEQDGDWVMDIRRDGERVRRYRVTRTIGSRFVQMYAGVQIDGPEEPGSGAYRREGKLPFAYWIARDEWFPQTYDEMPAGEEFDGEGELTAFYDYTRERRGGEWQRTCALCHNTYPYADRFGSLSGGQILGFPKEDLELTDKRPEAKDDRGASVLAPWQLVSLGISCESCHFGAREHALKGATISFVPRGEALAFAKATPELIAGARKDPYVVNAICGQCHTAAAQGQLYPHGGSSWNSAEAKDLRAGACASEIRCTDCHDPHSAGPVPAVDSPRQLQACVGCHEELAEPEAAKAHGSHEQAIPCVDCHMPRIVHGLDDMIRSHRISSPTHPAMLAGDQPNACNLCHLDRSLRWTLDALAEGWKADVDKSQLDLASDEAVGRRWLTHDSAIVRQVAADAYSRSPLGRDMLPELLATLADERPPNRMFGRLAIERLIGRRLTHDEYRPWASPAEREDAIKALQGSLKPRPQPESEAEEPAD